MKSVSKPKSLAHIIAAAENMENPTVMIKSDHTWYDFVALFEFVANETAAAPYADLGGDQNVLATMDWESKKIFQYSYSLRNFQRLQ